ADFRADTRATTNTINIPGSYMKIDNQDLRDLLVFLWDSYVESASPSRVILIGAGKGCKSLVDLINERDSLVMRKVVCSIMIPGQNPVPSVFKRLDLLNWYTEKIIHIGIKNQKRNVGNVYAPKGS
ncbi:3720_t:CDS:2, partial [Diversispora eburnea]